MTDTRALVLAGGGVAGIAWELGVLAGLSRQGVDVTAADLVLGTSAGAAVGAQVTSGVPLTELGARQLASETSEIAADFDAEEIRSRWEQLVGDARTEREALTRLGRMALEAQTVS